MIGERPAWWPAWQGRAVAIIASGVSAKQVNIAALRGRLPVMAIKENHELAPWADAVYGCDAAWWRNVNGLPNFKGLKISQDSMLFGRFRDLQFIKVVSKSNDALFEEYGVVGAGGNSGHQALNLVAQFGATRIMLIGFDAHGRSGLHWYGRNQGVGRNNPTEEQFRRWQLAFAKAAPVLEQRGIDVVNTSRISMLRCFRRQDLELTLEQWGLADAAADICRV